MSAFDGLVKSPQAALWVAHAAVCDYIAESARTISSDRLRDLAAFLTEVFDAADEITAVSYTVTATGVSVWPTDTNTTTAGATYTWTPS